MNSRVDLYTKLVLTVIAASLVALVVQRASAPAASAADAPKADDPQKVVVVGGVNVTIDGVGSDAWRHASLPVRITK